MRLFTDRVYQIPSKIQISMQQILRLLQLNLFEKRDLMALLRGDPPTSRYEYDNQPTLF